MLSWMLYRIPLYLEYCSRKKNLEDI